MLKPMRQQQGFSLPELLIAMVLGVLLVSAVINAYLATLNSTNQNNQQAQLNHNLRASLDLISSELKRAGGIVRPLALDSAQFSQYGSNPFMDSTSNLTLWNAADNTLNCTNNLCDCVTYSYDRNLDGDPYNGGMNHFGFKLQNKGLKMRKGGAVASGDVLNCSNGQWEGLTEDEVEITSFTLSYINAAGTVIAAPEQLDITNTDTTCESGTNCLETRNIAISITGSVGDYSLTVSNRVRVRNDRLFTVP